MGPEIDVRTFAEAHADGAFVVDVSEPREYLDGHVPGAVLMPLPQVLARQSELFRHRPVFVVCTSGLRSRTVTDWLRTRGIDAVSVAGGTIAWAAYGRPIVRGATPSATQPSRPAPHHPPGSEDGV
jgi:rhodanese-related sulfurtransferase